MFELAAARVSVFDSTPILYSASLLHWLPFFALGVVLADLMLNERPLSRWWLAGVGRERRVPGDRARRPRRVPALQRRLEDARARRSRARSTRRCWSSAACAGSRRVAVGPGWRVLATLGVSSYEIFLVQIVWFSLVPERGAVVVADIVGCCALGYALHRALRHLPALATG